MNYELLFPSKYLKAADLRGREVTLTIERIEVQELALRGTSQKERKGVIVFRQKRKDGNVAQLVLNRTNADTIAAMYGSETDDWRGSNVTLYPTRVRFGPKMVDAIRIRERVDKAAPPDSAPETYDEEPPEDWEPSE